MTRAARRFSVEEYAGSDAGADTELVRGELRVNPPPGFAHGTIVSALLIKLGVHVNAHSLGRVVTNAGVELLQLPRTVRHPDIAFVAADRIPPGPAADGFLRIVPDFIIEVRSPSDTNARLQEKLDDYRASGVTLIWVVDGRRREVRVVAGTEMRVHRGDDVLSADPVVRGFSIAVAEIFAS